MESSGLESAYIAVSEEIIDGGDLLIESEEYHQPPPMKMVRHHEVVDDDEFINVDDEVLFCVTNSKELCRLHPNLIRYFNYY